MIALASTVDSLLRVLYSSVIASVVIAIVFSFAVLGAIRAAEMRRASRAGPATAYVMLALIGAVAFTGTVVYGLILVTQKS
ncbi:MAG TPA: hypothetical protein VIH85_27895 [Solirubrobacteraceae bacterium]